MRGVARLGLTGGIGSGKSTVAAMLGDRGAAIIDADAISRQTTAAGGAAIGALREAFGPEFITPEGALDRERMRALAFSDPAARRRLEQIVHPLVGLETRRQSEQAIAAGRRCVVFDIPLLVESAHWRASLGCVLVVDCSPDTQIQRVMQRNGWTEDAVRRVIALQAPRDRRRAIADAVIFNDGLDPAALGDEVRALWALWNNQAR